MTDTSDQADLARRTLEQAAHPTIEITGNAELIKQTRENDGVQWRGHLNLEHYIGREVHLEKVTDAAGFKLRYWAILDKETNQVVSHCRALIRPLYVKEPNSSGVLEEDAVIANVFTVKTGRGKGYAKLLLRDVTAVLEKDYYQASLWSDIDDYYAQFGYVFAEEPSLDLKFPPQELAWPTHVEALDEETIYEVLPAHQEIVKSTVDTLAAHTTHAAVYPEEGLYKYFIERSKYIREHANLSPNNVYGAHTQKAAGVWAPSVSGDAVQVLALFAESHDDALPIVEAALHEANKLGLELSIYEGSIVGFSAENLLKLLQINKLDVKQVKRDSSLPMYKSKAKWVLPGHYAWF